MTSKAKSVMATAGLTSLGLGLVIVGYGIGTSQSVLIAIGAAAVILGIVVALRPGASQIVCPSCAKSMTTVGDTTFKFCPYCATAYGQGGDTPSG